MALRLISNPKRALFVGLLVVGALIIIASQRPSEPARATMATG